MFGIEHTVDTICTEQPIAAQVAGELVAGSYIGQAFKAEYNGLYRVEVYLSAGARQSAGPLILHIRTAQDAGTDLIAVKVNSEQVHNNAYQPFEFLPLRHSAGQHLHFLLEAPQAVPGNALAVWGTMEDIYADGEAILYGVKNTAIRDLTFRLCYKPSLREKALILLDRLASNKPSLWGDKLLYVGMGLTYLVLLYFLIIRTTAIGK
ncbi:MAG: hypothetical protein QXH51_08115 [Candidatus Bathyarchaeia archaeon]